MTESLERKPKKLFGKKKTVEFIEPQNTVSLEPINLFEQTLNEQVLLQDRQIESILENSSSRISIFKGPRVLDWNKSTGRVALAENVIKNSESEFMAFRRQMEMRADADGCGGRNEMKSMSLESGISNSNTLDVSKASSNKIFGKDEHSHKPGEGDHCSHGNDYGECPSGCKKAA